MQVMGLGSGLDIQTLIDTLMAVEEQPKTALANKQTEYQSLLNIWSDIKTKLTSFDDTIEKLQSQSVFQSKKTESSDQAVATISSSEGAVTGTYHLHVTSLATATKLESTGRMGNMVDLDLSLKDAGLGISVTKGSISVNGTSIEIDPETDSLNMVLERINLAETTTKVHAAFDSGTGKVTFSYTGLGEGTVQLGSGGDTSNLFQALWVDGKTGVDITSAVPLGSVNAGSILSSARFNTPMDASGEFEINGVKITYEASTESLNDIIDKINESSAQVNAGYDSLSDTITLTAKTTGSKTIQMRDLTGNFLAVTGLAGASQELGGNAEYSIDEINGGNTLTSSSNTISEALPGITISLKSQGESLLTVEKDADATVSAVKSFVNQYNTIMGVINSKLAKDGVLQGDSTLAQLQRNLRRMTMDTVSSGSDDLTLAGQIGLKIDSTGLMTLDEAKLKETLSSQPKAVYDLFNSADGIATRLDQEIDFWTKGTDGIIPNREKAINKMIENSHKEIEQMEARLEATRKLLEKQYGEMDSIVGQLNRQSTWLSTQLTALTGSDS